MFDYLLSRPMTPAVFDIIEHRLTRIYDYITSHNEDYEDVTVLFKRLSDMIIKYSNSDKDPKEVDKLIRRCTPKDISDIKERYQNGEFKIPENMIEELKDVLSTFSYAIDQYIEDNMNSFSEYMLPTMFNKSDFDKAYIRKNNVLGLVDILFGFEGE